MRNKNKDKEREKEMTPKESLQVMQRMLQQAQQTAHFTGWPFILSGMLIGGVFLAMAALYAIYPGRDWKMVMYAYPILFGMVWMRNQIKRDAQGSTRTLAENIILMVWNTGVLVTLVTILHIRSAHGIYVPPVLMLEFSIIALVSSYSNNDLYAYLIAFAGFTLSVNWLFKDGWNLSLGTTSCIGYAVSFSVLLVGIGLRWKYLAKHPERQKTFINEAKK